MEQISVCPLCSGINLIEYLSCKDNTVSKESFSIKECKGCSFLFTSPRPAIQEISKYYQSEDYISHSNSRKGLFNKLYQFIRNFTISQKEKLVLNYVSRGTLLDIGCGTGEFLNYCSKQNWRVQGVEPGLSAREFAQKTYNLSVYDEAYINAIPDSSYDVITLWHVLEHVHNLNERIDQLKKIVSDKGIILIAVPNPSSYDAKYYKEHWAAYDLPRHLYHFTPKTITQLFANHGLKKVDTLPMKFDSFYVSLLSEKYKTGAVNYLKAFIIGLTSNKKGRANLETYSSQIYIFKK
jgi:2-polyprenyl-3-methyl-5-hydroxy-6-metoxy-1,4-benzoquinol methylase